MQLHVHLKTASLLKIQATGAEARQQAFMAFHTQKK